MAPFSTQPPQEPALQQLGVEPVGYRPAMLPRYRETGGMDHVRFDATRLQPARQPEADPFAQQVTSFPIDPQAH